MEPQSLYLSVLKKIRAKWGDIPLQRLKQWQFRNGSRRSSVAPKTKGHIKAIMHRLFEKAMLWQMIELERNPMQLVEVKGISKRQKKPLTLTVDQYHCILGLLPQPYRTMVVVAQCLGLRAEEILALHWSDVDFNRRVIQISRAVVHGRIKTVKRSIRKTSCRLILTSLGSCSTGRSELRNPSWCFQATSRDGLFMPVLSNRTTSVLRDAAWSHVPGVRRRLASGVRTKAGNVFACIRSVGLQPEATGG